MTPAPVISIYHNPRCSNSRGALALIRERGFEPHIVEYLKTPPSRETLAELFSALGRPVREVLRSKEARYQELDLDNPKWSDDELIDFVAANPILLNRPIVVTPEGTKLCRPPETVLELLDELS